MGPFASGGLGSAGDRGQQLGTLLVTETAYAAVLVDPELLDERGDLRGSVTREGLQDLDHLGLLGHGVLAGEDVAQAERAGLDGRQQLAAGLAGLLSLGE